MVTYATGDLVEAGSDALVETGELIPRYIINFPTKRHWRSNSRLGDIESTLSAVVAGSNSAESDPSPSNRSDAGSTGRSASPSYTLPSPSCRTLKQQYMDLRPTPPILRTQDTSVEH